MPSAREKELERKHIGIGLGLGCPSEQLSNLLQAGIFLQRRQLMACAAARLCDKPDGPSAVGYGGARGGGKTHWLVSQLGADDCQRVPGLKCLLLRKVGKSNLENFESLRQRLFRFLPHEFNTSRGILTFANGSKIILGHYQCEKDIDTYLGLEYDVIGIEEATQLTPRKYQDIATCCRTSKTNWRPRIYSTTNPGGIGHQWYYDKFIAPHEQRCEKDTRFITARVDDNAFINSDYKTNLSTQVGWKYDAWYLGRWNFPAGQFFKNFRSDVHVIGDDTPLDPRFTAGKSGSFLDDLNRRRRFRANDATEWIAAMDYGYTHPTVVLLGCRDHEGNIYIMDEHCERYWIPQRHAVGIKAMFARHGIYTNEEHLKEACLAKYPDYCQDQTNMWHIGLRHMVKSFAAGTDIFSSESNGDSIAKQYKALNIRLKPANMDRLSGWADILKCFGDPDAEILPSLFIHKRCRDLLTCIPYLQHDPDRPGDLLKSNINDEGTGGDDAADALRYLVHTRPPTYKLVPVLA